LASVRRDELGLEEAGPGHPARLERRSCRLPAFGLHPVAIVGQQRRHGLPTAVRQEPWGAVRGDPLGDLMHHAWRQGQRAPAPIQRQQSWALGV
jgi:hypothetical protein